MMAILWVIGLVNPQKSLFGECLKRWVNW